MTDERKIIDYRTVAGDYIMPAVQSYIKDGWVPYGAPIFTPGGGLLQAMVKYEQPAEPTDAETRLRTLLADLLADYEVMSPTVLPALEHAQRRGYTTLNSQQLVAHNDLLMHSVLDSAAKLGVLPTAKSQT